MHYLKTVENERFVNCSLMKENKRILHFGLQK